MRENVSGSKKPTFSHLNTNTLGGSKKKKMLSMPGRWTWQHSFRALCYIVNDVFFTTTFSVANVCDRGLSEPLDVKLSFAKNRILTRVLKSIMGCKAPFFLGSGWHTLYDRYYITLDYYQLKVRGFLICREIQHVFPGFR